MKILLINIILFFSLSIISYSDPSAFKYSGSVDQGNINYIKEKDIAMEDELLEINYSPQFSKVKIKYVFQNHSLSSKKLDIAFPRTYMKKKFNDEGIWKWSEAKAGKFQIIKILFNGKKTDYQLINKPKDESKLNKYYEKLDEDSDLSYLFNEFGQVIEENIIFSLIFLPKQNVLEIEYEIENFLYQLQNSRSNLWESTPYHFYFVLKTGANWKNEKIKKFKTIIKLLNCNLKYLEILPKKFIKIKESYIWEESNFFPDEDLIIRYKTASN